MMHWLAGVMVALAALAGDVGAAPGRVAAGGLGSFEERVCGALPPLVEDSPAALQAGVAALAATAGWREEAQAWYVPAFLMCRGWLACEDADRLIEADLVQRRPEVREALVAIHTRAVVVGDLSPSRAAELLARLAGCTLLEHGLFGACATGVMDGAAQAVAEIPSTETPLPAPTAAPTATPTATSIASGVLLAVGRSAGAASWSGAGVELSDALVAAGSGLVVVLGLVLALVFAVYLLGAYYRSIDVRSQIHQAGAEARREMDEVSRQHLQAVTSVISGAGGDSGS